MKTIEKILGKNLPQNILDFINKQRIREFGKNTNLFKKKDHLNTIFFFVKDNEKIVSFGLLRDIKINYLGKTYRIKGIAGIISVEKGKGHGKILIHAIINYLRSAGKTGLGFCGRKNMEFYSKCGLKTEKDFVKRFVYKDPKTGKEIIDNDGDGLYLEGKDKFISRVLSTKDIVYIDILHW